MASKTTNYNLDMPAYNEIADIDVINGNMDKIDVQMKKNADSAQQSKDIVSDEYSATNMYAVGDYCIHENALYKCKTAITTGEAFDSNKWVQTTCGTEFGELNSNLYANAYNSQLNFVNCEYVAGGYTKIGNLVVVNIRIKCTNDGAVQINGFPTYTNKSNNGKNIVPITVYNMTDENTTNIKYSALAVNGFANLLSGIANKEYSLNATYICD